MVLSNRAMAASTSPAATWSAKSMLIVTRMNSGPMCRVSTSFTFSTAGREEALRRMLSTISGLALSPMRRPLVS